MEISCTNELCKSQNMDVKSASTALKKMTEILVNNKNEESSQKYISKTKKLEADADLTDDFASEVVLTLSKLFDNKSDRLKHHDTKIK